MTTQRKALKLAFEALRHSVPKDSKNAQEQLEAITAIKEVLAQPEQEREHITDGSPCWCEPDIEHYGLEPWQSDKKSATHGMTLGQRIAYVGGQVTDTGRVEFGSPMAVKALVDHVLRDITPPQRTWVGLMRGVRVEGDTVVISTKNNDAARELCGALIEELNT